MKIAGIETYSGPAHTAWALALMAGITAAGAIAGLQDPWWIGAAYGIAHFHGREQRDAETVVGETGKPMAPWQWHRKSQWDFWPVVAVCSAVAVMASIIG